MDRGRLPLALLLLALLVASGSGCSHSRWALRDPDYALHYPQQAETNLGSAKQALDARHVVGKGGTFVSGGGSGISPAGMAEVGIFGYDEHWFEYNGSLVGMYSAEETDIYLGLAGGVRVQSPSRVAPFAGVGGFAGLIRTQTMLEMIFDDEDDCGCEDEDDWDRLNPMFTVYPEVGMHFWLNTDTRLTTSVSYHISTEGRDSDMLMFNVELGKLNLPLMPRYQGNYGHERVETIRPIPKELGLARLPAPVEPQGFDEATPSETMPGVYQLPERHAPAELH